MEQIRRRRLLAGAGAFLAGPALAQAPQAKPQVAMTTDHGLIVVELEAERAPITSHNFLRYVDTRRYDGSSIYRAVRTQGAPEFGLIEGGLPDHPGRLLPPIAHESTLTTGLKHVDGTLSMARFAPGTARADFFICIGPAAGLDANPAAAGDNQGFAAFGQVVQGMDVARAILALPTDGPARNPAMKGQMLSPPVRIMTMRRVG